MQVKGAEQAEKAAVDNIIAHCPPVLDQGQTWYNIFWQAEAVFEDVKYLTSRGRVTVHPNHQHLVAISGA